MREILFKAKHLYKDEWVEGMYCKVFICRKLKGVIIPKRENMWCPEEIKENTLCQFTGLTDKNGNKIFDGDIVRVLLSGEPKPIGVVEYGTTGIMSFCVRTEKGYSNYVLESSEDFEVIGNKFENPELLEVEE